MLEIEYLGLQDYQTVQQRMQHYTATRDRASNDQLWFLQHESVYTIGCSLKSQPIPRPQPAGQHVPFVQSSRGGKITYHGPGQLVVYLMLYLKRYQLSLRDLVSLIETTLVDYLDDLGLKATTNTNAPGVYVNHKKIASLGLRISRGYCYHGFSLNIDMDLAPFAAVSICGSSQLTVTQLRDYFPNITVAQAVDALSQRFSTALLARSVSAETEGVCE